MVLVPDTFPPALAEPCRPCAFPEEVSSQVSTPAIAAEALAQLEEAIGYLAVADPAQMPADTQAQALTGLERLAAAETAARALILSAFTAGKGYQGDGAYSPRSWLIHQTKITRGAASGHLAWMRRAAAHPQVIVALAARHLSESHARTICAWSDKLPGHCQHAADDILLTAARAGADLAGLAQLAAEMYVRSLSGTPAGDDAGEDFGDRSVQVETTFEGAGVITGNLAPECAAVVGAVLDALSAPAGAEDDRSHAQRYHYALQEAIR